MCKCVERRKISGKLSTERDRERNWMSNEVSKKKGAKTGNVTRTTEDEARARRKAHGGASEVSEV